ncbi:MAG: VWA domain-containing protein [Bacteroidales bacterium]|nr:VWA domain-containing protein [Bacteroidales bacterium]
MKCFNYYLLKRNALYILMLDAFLFFAGNCIGQENNERDETLSPYFYIQSDDPDTDRMPLKSTEAKIKIAGVIADVTITQVYRNEGKNVLEAVYVFPASTRAAVYAMKMKIGEREISAVIQEKQQARQMYREAREEGKTASLLEQKRPNVFQMQVANILPGDKIVVELKYTELLVPENAIYQLVYPTVVGPRYCNRTESEAPEDGWIANPYLEEGKLPEYSFDISVTLNAGLPVKDILSPSHEVNVHYISKSQAEISLKDPGIFHGDRDFILRYKLAGKQIQSGVLVFEDMNENYFMAMIQPPQRVVSEMIPPREYIFIVDVSGSMHGFPLDISKELIKNLLADLRTIDKFNVLLFAGSSEALFASSMSATPENIKKAVYLVDRQQGGGSTELLPALKRALAMKGSDDISRIFVAITDGYVSVEKEAFDLISGNLDNANFFAFGIGSSVNRYLIEGMSHVGNGESFIITGQKEAGKTSEKFRKYISSPVLTDIKVEYPGFNVYDVQPAVYPDVFAEKPLIITGKYKGDPKGLIRITGKTADILFSESFDVKNLKPDQSNLALKYLWAREKIRLLDDYTRVVNDQDLVKQITGLGLKYNLLTSYTSFIAIDSEIRNNGETITTVKQPLPLPQGVSNYAVGSPSIKGLARRTSNASPYMAEHTTMNHDLSVETDPPEEVKAEEVFLTVEKMPSYPGGLQEFCKYISENIKLPSGMQLKNQKILVEFVVNVDGSLTEIRILSSVDQKISDEITRVLKACKKWTPGMQQHKAVKVKMIVPVLFQS